MLKDFVQTDRKYSSQDYMKRIREFQVPQGSAAVWYLGQNSYILKDSQGTLVAIDPYLTDLCGSGRTKTPGPLSRVLPVHIEPEDLDVDLVLITHSHDDHADPYTLERLDSCRNSAHFMAPFQAIKVLEDSNIPKENITMIHAKEILSFKGITIEGTFCLPTDSSDLNHLGFLITFPGDKTFYNTGDTAFVPLLEYMSSYHIDLMAVCINGGYMNLGHFDAARVTKMINPVKVTPCHYDVMPHNWQSPEVFKHSLNVVKADSELVILEYYTAYIF
jgi:L-ascorbate 6-phosphate lactonase